MRRAEISAHLAECTACAGEVRDLRGFVAESRSPCPPRSLWTYGALALAAVLVLAVGVTLRGADTAAPHVATLAGAEGGSALAPADAARVRRRARVGTPRLSRRHCPS